MLTRFTMIVFIVISMQALDGLFRENEKQEKQQRLEKRRKRLSDMLLKETKEYEVNQHTVIRTDESLTLFLFL